MRKYVLLAILLLSITDASAQLFRIEKPVFGGIYFQWGYSRGWFTKSDIHIQNGTDYDFTIYDVKALDKPDWSAFKNSPLDITIPQNVYRLGVYLNKERTHAIEFNYDHAKWVQIDDQTLRMKGRFDGKEVDGDVFLDNYVVHVEHTNGANFYQLNYVGQKEVLHNHKKNSQRATILWKVGGGVVIPKSFIILDYQKLDNKFKVSGIVGGVELCSRFYPFKNFFLEASVKGGYANYLNALALGGGKVSHDFWYTEVIGMIGYDMSLGFLTKKKPVAEPAN